MKTKTKARRSTRPTTSRWGALLLLLAGCYDDRTLAMGVGKVDGAGPPDGLVSSSLDSSLGTSAGDAGSPLAPSHEDATDAGIEPHGGARPELDGGARPDGATRPERDGAAMAEACGPGSELPPQVLALPLFRLQNATTDLLGRLGTAEAFAKLERDPIGRGGYEEGSYRFTAPKPLSAFVALVDDLVGGGTRDDVQPFLPCDPAATGEEACRSQFVASFGRRAFGRPLEPSELTFYNNAFANASRADGFLGAVALTMKAFLLAPRFVYDLDIGAGTQTDEWTLARRLAALVWGSVPNSTLLGLAETSQLRAQLEVQVSQMLSDARTPTGLRAFYRQWLPLEGMLKKPEELKAQGFTAELANDMREASLRFIEDVIHGHKGTLSDLFTAPVGFMNGRLAQHYGASGIAGESFTRVDLDPRRAAGVLTSGAVLVSTGRREQSNPMRRGVFVSEKILCKELPDLPADVAVPLLPPIPADKGTNRQRYEMSVSDVACQSCHELFDPYGYAFEAYDGLGRWRDSDNGLPVNTAAEVKEEPRLGRFDGVVELAKALASSGAARSCHGKQWAAYALGRSPQQACLPAPVLEKIERHTGSVQGLLSALATSSVMTGRRPARAPLTYGAAPALGLRADDPEAVKQAYRRAFLLDVTSQAVAAVRGAVDAPTLLGGHAAALTTLRKELVLPR